MTKSPRSSDPSDDLSPDSETELPFLKDPQLAEDRRQAFRQALTSANDRHQAVACVVNELMLSGKMKGFTQKTFALHPDVGQQITRRGLGLLDLYLSEKADLIQQTWSYYGQPTDTRPWFRWEEAHTIVGGDDYDYHELRLYWRRGSEVIPHADFRDARRDKRDQEQALLNQAMNQTSAADFLKRPVVRGFERRSAESFALTLARSIKPLLAERIAENIPTSFSSRITGAFQGKKRLLEVPDRQDLTFSQIEIQEKMGEDFPDGKPNLTLRDLLDVWAESMAEECRKQFARFGFKAREISPHFATCYQMTWDEEYIVVTFKDFATQRDFSARDEHEWPQVIDRG